MTKQPEQPKRLEKPSPVISRPSGQAKESAADKLKRLLADVTGSTPPPPPPQNNPPVSDFFGGDDENGDESGGLYPGTNFNLDGYPQPKDGEIFNVFHEMGWSSYADAVYDTSLSNAANREPNYDRPGLYPSLNDAILEAYDLGILDFTTFYYDGRFWHLYIYGSNT